MSSIKQVYPIVDGKDVEEEKHSKIQVDDLEEYKLEDSTVQHLRESDLESRQQEIQEYSKKFNIKRKTFFQGRASVLRN